MSELEKIVTGYKRADESLVDDLKHYSERHYIGVEQRIEFLSDRLLLAATAIARIGQALVDERAADSATGEQK